MSAPEQPSHPPPQRLRAWTRSAGAWLARVFWTRRAAVAALVVVASVLAVGSAIAIYAKAVALDTPVWTDASGKLLANEEIRPVVADFLVDELFARTDVERRVEALLPDALGRIGALGVGALREFVRDRMDEFLALPVVQELWVEANRQMHEDFLRAVETGSNAPIVLDLGALAAELARRIGLPEFLARAVERSDTAQVTVLEPDQVDSARDVANAMDVLSIVLGIVTVLLWALAVWLAAGRRRETVRAIAVGLLLAGLVLVVVRRVVGTRVVEALTEAQSVEDAGVAAWLIATDALVTVMWVFATVGVLGLVWSTLLGPTRLAVGARRRFGPFVRDRRGVFYALAAVVALLLIAFGPLGNLTGIVAMAIILVLLVVAIESFRRAVVRELAPAAEPGEAQAPPAST